MNYTIKNEDIEAYNESDSFPFPKYTSQLINLANQNAQGTRPAVVGQMSDLFQEFRESQEEKALLAGVAGTRKGIRTHFSMLLKNMDTDQQSSKRNLFH